MSKTIKLDIVSDLHIDQWSLDYKNIYPCGTIKDKPYEFKQSNSDYLIVAGDISDNLEDSITYLNQISKFYKKILFVDGNHEHVHKYPNLYNNDEIQSLITNNKLVYISKTPFKINETIFIGNCGWWDYNNLNPDNIEKLKDYFKNWIPHFTKEDNMTFVKNVIEKSQDNYLTIKSLIDKYEKNNTIKNIVIITHTVPRKKYCDTYMSSDGYPSQHNSKFTNLFKNSKISHWIFGHTHQHWYDTYNNIQFISNGRGRPDDFDREEYKPLQIEIQNQKSNY